MDKTFPDNQRQLFEELLKKFVEMPTVSSDEQHKPDIKGCAQFANDLLVSLGFESEINETPGNPIIYGHKIGNSEWPTVLLYNHLDVQPADANDWASDPFKLITDGDKYIGRGTTDDKGPALCAFLAAKHAIESGVKLNFKIIWEFEEEIGSPNFGKFVADNASKLAADSILVSDTVWVNKNKPAIAYGLRGLITFEVKVETAEHDVHSGLAGGAARNPIAEICEIIAKCQDAKTGRVLIPGFYDNVLVPTDDQKEDFVNSGFSAQKFAETHSLKSLRTTGDKATATRVMAEPTFEIHGITGGYSGQGVKTVVPPSATAKLSCRLIADQDPDTISKQISDFMTILNQDAEITFLAKTPAYLCNPDNRYTKAAAQVVSEVTGVVPALVREGGSIGAVISLDQYLQVPIVMLGLSLPEDGYHALDEHYNWSQADKGINIILSYFRAITFN